MKLLNIIFRLWILSFCDCYCLKIVSYNLNYEIKWKDKKNDILKILTTLDADVIALQEVNKPYVAKDIAKKLKLNFNKKYWHIGGTCLLSKFEIIDSFKINIPGSYYNAFLAIKINPSTIACCIHLDSRSYKIDDTLRLQEIKFILQQLNKLNAPNIILAGDFNCLQESCVNSFIESNGFIDTHKNLNIGTWMPSNGNERIDRIYFKGNFKIADAKILDYNDFTWLQNWPTGNDHRLVFSTLEETT